MACDGIDDIRLQSLGSEINRGQHRFFCKSRMGFKYLFDRFASGKLLQNQLYGSTRSDNDWLAHRYPWIGDDLGMIHISSLRNIVSVMH
jgi:hypothetical protein